MVRERCAAASRARGEATAGTLGFFDIGVFVEGFVPFPRLALKSLAPRLHESRRHYDQWHAGELSVECRLDGSGSCSVAVHADGRVHEHRLELGPDPASYHLTCRAIEPSSPMRMRFDAG